MKKLYEVAPYVICYYHRENEDSIGMLEHDNERGIRQPMIFTSKDVAEAVCQQATLESPEYVHEVCRIMREQ